MSAAALPLDILPVRPHENANTSYTIICRDEFTLLTLQTNSGCRVQGKTELLSFRK